MCNLVMRKFPTKYHASKWPMVERMLCIRSMLAQAIYLAAWFYGFFTKMHRWAKVQDYLDEGGPPNAQLARDLYPYGKFILLTIVILKTVLLVASLPKLKVSKSFFVVMAIHNVVKFVFMPLDLSGFTQDHLYAIVLDIFLYSFDVWSGLILGLVMTASLFGARAVYFEESFAVGGFINITLLVSLAVLATQCFYNKIGFLVIETELLREGND